MLAREPTLRLSAILSRLRWGAVVRRVDCYYTSSRKLAFYAPKAPQIVLNFLKKNPLKFQIRIRLWATIAAFVVIAAALVSLVLALPMCIASCSACLNAKKVSFWTEEYVEKNSCVLRHRNISGDIISIRLNLIFPHFKRGELE